MTTILLRRNSETGALANDTVLQEGEPGFVPDFLDLGVGDGVTAWDSLRKYVNTLGAADGNIPYYSAANNRVTWGAPPTSGGGTGETSSTVVPVIDLGTAGANLALEDPTQYGMQYAALNGVCNVQLPAPVAGCRFLIILDDTVGGTEFSFSGATTDTPGGTITPISAPGKNVIEAFSEDGTGWNLEPGSSGTTAVVALALRIQGAVSGSTTPFRFVGAQVTGAPPTYANPAQYDLVLDFGANPWTIWACTVGGATPTWQAIGGGGTTTVSGVVVNSPGYYARPSYDKPTQTWLAANPNLVDVTAHYDVNPASTDVSAALATGIQDITAAGLKPWLPPGMVSGSPVPYNLKNPLVIGDGSASKLSDWTGWLEGSSIPSVTGETSYYALPQQLVTRFLWTAASGANEGMVQVLGPVASVGLRNLLFDANGNKPLTGIQTVSVRNSHFENLAFYNVKGGAIHTTVGGNVDGLGTNDGRNTWKRISYGCIGNGATMCGGIMFTNGSLGTGGDSCYEEYDGVWIESSASGPPAGAFGIIFQCCDSIRMRNVNVAAGGWQAATLYDYTYAGGAHPADCVIDVIEMGGQQWGAMQKGSPAGAGTARNRIMNISACNGQPANPILINPTTFPSPYGPITNTTWGSPYLTGQVQLTGGSGSVQRSMIAWINGTSGIGNTNANGVTLPVNMRFSLVGAPGSGGAGELYVASVSGTTAEIQSTNATDNSLYNWELLTP